MSDHLLHYLPGMSFENKVKLAQGMRSADRVECGATGDTPYASLCKGQEGPHWTLFWGDDPIGAAGFTEDTRLVWSYFLELSMEQAQALYREAVTIIRRLVEQAGPGYPLHNMVWERNHAALTWLQRSHCFDIDWSHPLWVVDRRFLPFHAKPLGEMPVV